jgi:hypothetical protein
MKHQIVLTRVPQGILVDGPSLEKPTILEKYMHVIEFVRKELNYLPDIEPFPYKIVPKEPTENETRPETNP